MQCCAAWACWVPAWAALARKTTCKLVVDEAVHPIRRHYTPSDRVYRDVTGVPRRKWCTDACCSRDGGPLKSERERLAVWGSWAMRRYTPSGAVSPRNAALLRADCPAAGAIAVWVKQARQCSREFPRGTNAIEPCALTRFMRQRQSWVSAERMPNDRQRQWHATGLR